jgi:hypothetical protein
MWENILKGHNEVSDALLIAQAELKRKGGMTPAIWKIAKLLREYLERTEELQ